MKQFHVNRLKRLRQIFEDLGLSRDHVSLGAFGGIVYNKENNPCGIYACILGWAGLDRSFRRRGLVTDTELDTVVLLDEHTRLAITRNPFDAGKRFFGLEGTEIFDGAKIPEITWARKKFPTSTWQERQRQIAINRLDNLLAKIKEQHPELTV